MGPLPISLWRSISPGDSNKAGAESVAIRVDGEAASLINGRKVTTTCSSYMTHTLFVVELPSREETIRTLTDLGAEPIAASTSTQGRDSQPLPSASEQTGNVAEIDDSPWLAEDESITIPTGEMTIQEALRNAENAFNDAIDLTAFEGIDTNFEGGHGSEQQAAGQDAQGQHQGHEDEQEQDVGREVVLTKPGVQQVVETELSLPILLVRKEDGVGFGTGSKLVFPRTVEGEEWVPRVNRQ